jgi:hypothetical protein
VSDKDRTPAARYWWGEDFGELSPVAPELPTDIRRVYRDSDALVRKSDLSADLSAEASPAVV